MQAEIEAETAKQEVFEKAIAEEEGDVLMRQPSVLDQSCHTSIDQPVVTKPTFQVQPLQPSKSTFEQPSTPVIVPQQPTVNTAGSQVALPDSLAAAINTIRMKPAEPPVFYGDPLQYVDWKLCFEGLVESTGQSPIQHMTLLQHYLGGRAKDAVVGFFCLGTTDAYQDAKKKLSDSVDRKSFPKRLEISLTSGQRNVSDGEGLEKFADLDLCKTAMVSVSELQCLGIAVRCEAAREIAPFSEA